MRLPTLTALTAGLLLAAPASAVTWSSVEREAWVHLMHPGSQVVEWTHSGPGPWNGTFREEEGMWVTDPWGDDWFETWYARVDVQSDVSDGGLSYFGTGSSWAGVEEFPEIQWLPRAGATLDATFVLDDPHRITMSGFLTGFSDAPDVFSSLLLTGPAGTLLSWRTSLQDELFVDVDHELDLAPGTYRLQLEIYERCYCSTEFPFQKEYPRIELSLALTPLAIPEPGTALLLALGLAGVVARGRPHTASP